ASRASRAAAASSSYRSHGRGQGSAPRSAARREARVGKRGEANRARPRRWCDHDVGRLEAELAAARRAAEEAIIEKRAMERDQLTFLALVAHQLKSPLLPLEVSLRTIQSALERGRSLPPDTLARTDRQVRRLSRAIDALLVDLPKVEEGSLT